MNTAAKHYAYMYGKLSEAAYCLAVGEGNIKSRLMWASEKFASFGPLLPPAVAEKWRALWGDMNRFPATECRTSFQETLHRVRYKTAGTFARRLLAIQVELENYC